jgi:RNA polymerase sigma-70 factor, ECF subfamily
MSSNFLDETAPHSVMGTNFLYSNFLSAQGIQTGFAIPKADHQRLTSLAYGYLGSLSEAEDIVQDALVRLIETGEISIINKIAWLTTVVTRLSLDRLRSAQHRRELYPGEWLPEPVFGAPGPEQDAITRSRLTLGLLYVLEKLEPAQRVSFVLREVFEHSYRSIAEITGRSETSCRQLMTRARATLARTRHDSLRLSNLNAAVADRFINALTVGDEAELVHILADDAVLVGDGGGKVPSALNPIFGADRIARFFTGVRRKTDTFFHLVPELVNSGPGILAFRDGELAAVIGLSINDDRLTAIYFVSNPDKIKRTSTSQESQ